MADAEIEKSTEKKRAKRKWQFSEYSVWIRDLIENSAESGSIVDIEYLYEPGERDIITGIYVTFRNGEKLKITVEDVSNEQQG